jgi:hypothetical protein
MKRCALLVVAAIACSGGQQQMMPPPDAGDPNQVFLAEDADFADFRAWAAYPVPPGEDGGFIHDLGPRTEYLNEKPPHGATVFPLGTIIVKAMMADPPRNFAMAKRGGDYNDAGAENWEFFEIIEPSDGGSNYILWRGEGAPVGSQYPGSPDNLCNGCHLSSDNDHVNSQALQLTNF